MRVDQDSLSRKLNALLGDDVRPPTFDRTSTLSGGIDALKVSVLEFARELSLIGRLATSPVLEELAQAAIVKLLIYQKHDYSDRLFQSEKAPSRKQLDRLIDYILANWDKPLTVECLANKSNVGARTIIRLFLKEKGCSPTSYIKQVRLQHAKTMLLYGSRDRSVLSIALKCGFHSFGHFAREYRLAFGELPSETLRSSRQDQSNAKLRAS